MITPQQAYEASKAKGFYDPIPSKEQRLVLIISELGEAVDAIRKERWFNGDPYLEQVISEYKERITATGRKDAYEEYLKGTVEEEFADTYIRILDYMGFREIERDQVEPKYKNLPKDDMGWVLLLMTRVTDLQDKEGIMEDIGLNNILFLLETYARQKDFDLHWHVEQKFKYNQSRPFKHGKTF